MNCHVYLSASMEKINQDITVVYWNQAKMKKIPSRQQIFLKNLKLQITARSYTFEHKKIKEKSYPYVHTLSLAYKECKRLLWNQQCENKRNKKHCCIIWIYWHCHLYYYPNKQVCLSVHPWCFLQSVQKLSRSISLYRFAWAIEHRTQGWVPLRGPQVLQSPNLNIRSFAVFRCKMAFFKRAWHKEKVLPRPWAW